MRRVPAADRIYIDETGTHTAMTRRYGRAPAGTRVVGEAPAGHWQVTTVIAGLGPDGVVAPFAFEGATDATAFETYVERVLVPELRPGQVVVLDNLSSHKGPRVRALIEAAGARLEFLPPYSCDFNPIEEAWAKLKEHLRAVGARAREALWAAIGAGLAAITPEDCRGFFASCGIRVAPT